jgi:PAS domain S-box-containing protein
MKDQDKSREQLIDELRELRAHLARMEQERVKCKKLEKALKETRCELEKLVQERTQELVSANEEIQVRVDEREAVEKKLRDSEERFRSLAESSPNMIFMNQGGKVVYANKACEEIMGYSRKELYEKDFNFLSIIAPESHDQVLASYENHKNGREVLPYEYTLLTRGGRRIEAIITTKLVELNGVHTIIGIVTDITERKQVEEALRVNEERFRTVFQYAPIGIAIANRNEIFIRVNQNFCHLLGLDESEALGKSYMDVTHPDDRAASRQHMQALTEGSCDHYEHEKRFIKKNGDSMWAIVRVTGIRDQNGVIRYFLGLVEDITERKRIDIALRESHDTLVTVLESIDADVYVADMDTYDVLYANRSMENSFGKGLIGKKCYQVLRKESRPCAHCNNDHLLSDEGKPLSQRSGEMYNPVTRRWYIDYDRAIKWIDGRYVRLQVATDITEKKKMEEEIQKAEKLESIGVLAGGIAHDFNNILAAILGNVSLAKMRIERDDKNFFLLEEVEKASARATALTKQLLTFSKGGTPVKKMASISEIVRESASFALRGSNAKCTFDIPEDIWFAEVDEGQISHVFHNLIINADQAMPDGGIIHIQGRNLQVDAHDGLPLDPGMYLEISLHDQGKGIPEDYIPKIFDPYFTTKHRGSGLGLATSYSIIKKHRGHIQVDSQLGEGATFLVYLPASEQAARAPITDDIGRFNGSGKILVMDDEEMIRDLASEMLSTLGYDTVVVQDGCEAVEMYREALSSGEPFIAVILDLTVPGGMGGREAAEKLQELDPGVRAIVSSGYSTDPVLSNYREYGFCSVAVKPYKIDDMGRILHEAINGFS